MYLNKTQIKAVRVALDVLEIMQVYGEDTEEIRSAYKTLEELKKVSEQKHKT